MGGGFVSCKAPQTRKYWNDLLFHQGDAEVMSHLKSAQQGWTKWKNESSRHKHDWTIYRNCCIREARKRGLNIDAFLGT